MVLANTIGQGQVTYALPIPEAAVAGDGGDREARDRWQRWYAAMVVA